MLCKYMNIVLGHNMCISRSYCFHILQILFFYAYLVLSLIIMRIECRTI